jgi:hypothetical protein
LSDTGKIPPPRGHAKKQTEKEKPEHSTIGDRKGIVQAVTSPLNFSALSVLVCEAIIGTTTVASKLTPTQEFIIILLMVGLVAAMIALVGWTAWKRAWVLSPEMATATKAFEEAQREAQRALAETEQLKRLIADQGFRDVIIKIVQDQLVTISPIKSADGLLTQKHELHEAEHVIRENAKEPEE